MTLRHWLYGTALVAHVGCVAFAGDSVSEPRGPDTPGIPDPAADAGADGASQSPAPPANDGVYPGGAFAPDRMSDGEAGDFAGSCHDGDDNDTDTLADCADPACAELPSCCVGRGDCCETVEGLPTFIPFATCTGPLSECPELADVTLFGAPGPQIIDGWFVPSGDDSFDSGAVIGDAVNLTTHRVQVSAAIGFATACGDSCLEGVALALAPDGAFGDSSHVRPSVALLYSSARASVSVLVGDEVVKTVAVSELVDEETWSLDAQPSGRFAVRRGEGALVYEGIFHPVAAARLLAYGRNRASVEDGIELARIGDITTETSLCDMPAAWESRTEIVIRSSVGAWNPDMERGPSIAVDDAGMRAMAVESAASVYFATDEDDDGEFDLVRSENAPALAPSLNGADAGGIYDPELVWDSLSGAWSLFYTAVSLGGDRNIGMARLSPPQAEFTRIDSLAITASTYDLKHIEAPAVLIQDGEWLLVATVTLSDGTKELRPFESSDGQTWVWRAGDLGDESAMLEGEVGSASFVAHNAVWQLYAAVRDGARSSVVLFVSDDFLDWSPFDGGTAVFSASRTSFDALSVSDPDVLSDGNSILLMYAGSDGIRSQVGATLRAATANSATL